ncbi:1-deoxy-D-xylulose 5-phosphate reductoisomerase [Candidatus Zixiibacteriota bacterium]|nr:1-deoxy-D-xylulose 5-phosphate reductoisomerase [candidate division Zixibacteria bacterium]
MKKRAVILGSTGSIGRAALDVAGKNNEHIEIIGLSAHANADLLLEQTKLFHPRYVALTDREAYARFKKNNNTSSRLLDFDDGISALTALPDADLVLNAIVGAAGLKASLQTLEAGKRLALANKESMVIGGHLINGLIKQGQGELIPVDSEHSAIWQALKSGNKPEIRKLILTGSGGPFRTWPREKLDNVTIEQALNHPTWKMGPKITIDSATMMNKGLEIIEASFLFDVTSDKIEVVIHPQSIIHSLLEFIDSSVIAQMSYPDMRLPIAYAMFYPERRFSDNGHFSLTEMGQLTFESPDFAKFPLLKAAYDVTNKGGTLPAVFNAANEVAVAAFLRELIKFGQIPDIVINTVGKHVKRDNPAYEDIVDADRWGRQIAHELAGLN